MVIQQSCEDVLKSNYLPYALAVIVGRAIPNIDGLKPVHRRVLYTMYEMNLFKDRSKSSNVVGQTMKYHPNGDSSIYDALVRMTGNANDRELGNNALLLPYVDGKGNFGRVYSNNIEPAAPRYTEVKLHDWTKELLFDGIDEEAVTMIDNYDSKFKEPLLLPVKFPNILVNTSPGLAVGMQSHIPSYNLREVCEATRAVIDGSAKNIQDLSKIMLAPDYPMGGIIHTNGTTLLDALDKKGSVYVSAKMNVNGKRLTVSELPYQVKVEAVIRSIGEMIKVGEFSAIEDIQELTGINGFNLSIDFKNKNLVDANIDALLSMGKLRNSVHYTNRCIIDGKARLLDVYDLINEWLLFRLSTLDNIYNFRLNKGIEKEVDLKVWEIVRNDIESVAKTVTSMSEKQAKQSLKERFSLDDRQVNALVDVKLKELSTDNADKKLRQLEEIRKDIKKNKGMIESKESKLEQVYEELGEIGKKYGTPRNTIIGGDTNLIKPSKVEDVIDNSKVTVIVTSDGYIKKFRNKVSEDNFSSYLSDDVRIVKRYECANDEKLLVFTNLGTCHCIPINKIDESKGDKKMSLSKFVPNDGDAIYITTSEDRDKTIYFVLNNGRGVAVPVTRVLGGLANYRGLYSASETGQIWATDCNKFFYVASENKVAYTDLSTQRRLGNSTWAFKICRVLKSETIRGIVSANGIADFETTIEPYCAIYTKGYFVKLKHNIFKKRAIVVKPKEEEILEV